MEIYDVFISYRRSDGAELARDIANRLRKAGLHVFFDTDEIKSGESFPKRIEDALKQAPNYLLVATPDVFRFREGEDWVREEMITACENFDRDNGINRMFTVVVPDKGIIRSEEWPEKTRSLAGIDRTDTTLEGKIPTEKEFEVILTAVTRITRHNMWNAAYRWLEENRKAGRRFAKLNIVESILPTAGRAVKADLPQQVQIQDNPGEEGRGDKRPLMQALQETAGHIYLIGPGGIGKTTALMNIMEDNYGKKDSPKPYDETRQIPLFVELSGAPDHLPLNLPKDTAPRNIVYYSGMSTFIRRSLYRQIRRYRTLKEVSDREVEELDEVFFQDYKAVVEPVDDLLTKKTPAPEYLLLLDGLNEIPRTEIRVPFGSDPEDTRKYSVIELVRNEIKWLMKECPNVKVVITGRTDEDDVSGIHLTRLLLSGIEDDEIRKYLRSAGFSEDEIKTTENNIPLFETIRTPLFLTMYVKLRDRKDICTQGEILHTFFTDREENPIDYGEVYTQQGHLADIENEAKRAEQLPKIDADMQAFMIDFLIPAIGREMEKKNLFRIDSWKIESLLTKVLMDKSPTAICGRWGQKAFTKYRSKGSPKEHVGKVAKRMLEVFGNDEEERTQEILDIASLGFGILSVSANGDISFVHQHIRDYFAALEVINSIKISATAFENDDKETAHACIIAELDDDALGFTVRRFIGEALGEHHNRSWCDAAGNWHKNIPKEDCDRSLLKRAISVFRNYFGVQDPGSIHYGVWNLIQILMEVRWELCGEDFSYLDLTGIRLSGYPLGKQGCSAVFTGSKIDKQLKLPTPPPVQNRIPIRPDQRKSGTNPENLV